MRRHKVFLVLLARVTITMYVLVVSVTLLMITAELHTRFFFNHDDNNKTVNTFVVQQLLQTASPLAYSLSITDNSNKNNHNGTTKESLRVEGYSAGRLSTPKNTTTTLLLQTTALPPREEHEYKAQITMRRQRPPLPHDSLVAVGNSGVLRPRAFRSWNETERGGPLPCFPWIDGKNRTSPLLIGFLFLKLLKVGGSTAAG